MDKQNNNKGVIALLIVIIVILATLCVLFATGTINFNTNKVNDEDTNENANDNKNEVNNEYTNENANDNKNEVNNEYTNENANDNKNEYDNSIIESFVGTYEYKGEYVDNEENIGNDFTVEQTTYDKVALTSSGTAEANAGNVRGGGYSAKGKWYISNNELIIINDQCKAIANDGEVMYPNCSPIWTYSYKIENEELILTSNNNSMTTVNLNKIN